MTERILPHSSELERALLGAMLQDDGAAAVAAATLTPEDFYHNRDRLVFKAALCCVNRGIPPDLPSVGEELSRQEKLFEVGATYLSDLVEQHPTAAHVSHHAKQIRDLGIRRRIIEAAEQIAATGYGHQGSLDEYRALAEATLFGAMQAGTEDDLLTPAKLAATLDKNDPPFTLSAGFTLWDTPTPILEAGCLTVLAGRPGIGKTALACGILARHTLSTPPVPSLFFSAEQTGRQIAIRVLAIHSGASAYAVKMSPDPWDVEKLAASSIYVRTAGAPTLASVLARVRGDRAMYGIRFVVVDHIGKIAGGRRDSRTLEIGDVARGLKGLAKDFDIPVLALCQLNRAVEGRDSKRPRLADLRESGEIEQEADSVLFLWTPEETITKPQIETRMTLAKSRDGATGEIATTFDRPRLTFSESQRSE